MYSREEAFNEALNYFGNTLSADVWVDKYALRNQEVWMEKSPDETLVRIAKECHRIEQLYPNPLDYEEILGELNCFHKIIFQGGPMAGIGNPYQLTSLSNCVVADSPADSLAGIMDTSKELALLYSRRAGVGVDISTLRPEKAAVNNAALTSTGAWSFADLFSYITRMVASKGRRGALMVTIDCYHPDILQFIGMKADLSKVTGANVSVHWRDSFLDAVFKDEAVTLQFPIEVPLEQASFTRKVRARDIWNEFIKQAADNAEPGAQFWDTEMRMNPASYYDEYRAITSNPCGEQFLAAGDSCRLISLNLIGFVKNAFTSKAFLSFCELKKACRIAARLADDLVDLEIERLQKVVDATNDTTTRKLFGNMIRMARGGRRVGISATAIADMLAQLGMTYATDDANNFLSYVFKVVKTAVYKESINLGKERGVFEGWDWEKEKSCPYWNDFDIEVLDSNRKYGRRNVSLLTLAPQGSISMVARVSPLTYRSLYGSSSGVEEPFRLSYTRRRKVHEGSRDSLHIDNQGDAWEEYTVNHPNLELWELCGEPSTREYVVDSTTTDYEKKIEMQAILQEHIDNSISTTVNIPNPYNGNISREVIQAELYEQVSRLYKKAWLTGCKGLTIYVEGSRAGVLIADTEPHNAFEQRDATLRPDMLIAEVHKSIVGGVAYVFIIGLLQGKPYEVFSGKAAIKLEPAGYLQKVKKLKRNRYNYIADNGTIVEDIVDKLDEPSIGYINRLISLSLRHGSSAQFIVEQILKDKSEEFTAYNRAVARVLKKYIPDGVKSTGDKTCPKCGQDLSYQEGCVTCYSCGHTKCN